MLFLSFFIVQYVVYICRYMKEWRKNPQWSLSCCLALLLPLNDLQGEIRGLAGRNVLKHQLQTGKIDMPSMSGALKDSGAVTFSLEEEATSPSDERDGDKETIKERYCVEQSILTFSHISIHELPRYGRETCDTYL